MNQRTMILNVPPDFSFWRTVLSHGWSTLQPFFLDRSRQRLLRVLQLDSQPALAEMRERRGRQGSSGGMRSPRSAFRPGPENGQGGRGPHPAVGRIPGRSSIGNWPGGTAGAGSTGSPGPGQDRLLRAPSFFEDMVKMICTTNCSWKATQRMVTGMVQKLGTRLDSDYCCFPGPEKVAGTTDEFLRREIGCGYRGEYLIELAERVATGRLPNGDWEDLTGEEAHRRLLATKGIGPYAAGNLLKLLGHYDHLSLDSWVRPRFAAVHGLKRVPKDSAIQRHYRPFRPLAGTWCSGWI